VFRSCGVAGFYGAIVATLGGGIAAGRSPLPLAVVCLVAGTSFFVWALLRRFVTGDESYVLLEHVWFAEAAVAATMWALGEPVLPSLDALSLGLCVFLAAGRVGCTLVGCCRGRPSSLGIRYGHEHVRDGFPAELAGVRLFPVPLFEAGGLLGIGAGALAALVAGRPGVTVTWFLLSYSVLRFGLEGLRGDRRPHLLGLSVNRWMCLTEFAGGLALGAHERGGLGRHDLILLGVLALALPAALALRRAVDPRPRLLAVEHLRELRALAAELTAAAASGAVPEVRTSSRGVALAISQLTGSDRLHTSVSCPSIRLDLELVCRIAAEVVGSPVVEETRLADSGILHLVGDADLTEQGDARRRARLLYGAALRQRADAARPDEPEQRARPRAAYFEPSG
jgi:hypothetical protein